MIAAPLMLTLLATASPPTGALSFVRSDAGWVPVERICRHGQDLVYLSESTSGGEEMVRIDVDTGAPRESVVFKPAEPEEWEGAAGTLFRITQRTDGKRSFTVDESLSNYYQDWLSTEVISEQTPRGPRFAASCPGGRVLMQCFTSRRTVEVELEGDLNDESPLFSNSYRAFAAAPTPAKADLAGSPRETLHLTHGKIARSASRFSAEFGNQGFRYAIDASLDPESPGATLTVFKGHKQLQAEVCVGYTAFPDQPAKWLEAHHREGK